MANIPQKSVLKSAAKDVVVFTIHQFVGTWGIAVFAYLMGSALFDLFGVLGWTHSLRPLHWVLTENPYFPVQIMLGFYSGWQIGRTFKHRSMLWVWIVPGLILCCTAARLYLGPEPPSILDRSLLSHYFGWGCQPKNGCLDQLFLTMPFYTAIAYSVGARLALGT